MGEKTNGSRMKRAEIWLADFGYANDLAPPD
jgi:hypothetical protein